MSENEIKENLKLELPRASAFDEKIKKYSCEAKMIVGGSIQLPITYESQLDDSNQHIVAVGGILKGDIYAISYTLVEAIKKAREPVKAQEKALTAESKQAQPGIQNTATLIGKSPDSALDEPALQDKFKLLLGSDLIGFRERLNVSSGIEQEGDWLIGEGGMPHLMCLEEAAYAINTKTGELFAIMLTEGKTMKWFGAAELTDLPGPLQNWHKNHGGN